MVDRHDIDALLIGSLYGELSSADEARLRAHLESHPADRTALDGLAHAREAVRASRIFEVQLEPSQAVSALLLQEAARRAPRKARDEEAGEGWFARLRRSFLMHPAMAAAAMLVVVVGVAGTIYVRQGDHFAAPEVPAPAARGGDTALATAPAAPSPAPAAQAPSVDPTLDGNAGAGQDQLRAKNGAYRVGLAEGDDNRRLEQQQTRPDPKPTVAAAEAAPRPEPAVAEEKAARPTGPRAVLEVTTPQRAPKDFADEDRKAEAAKGDLAKEQEDPADAAKRENVTSAPKGRAPAVVPAAPSAPDQGFSRAPGAPAGGAAGGAADEKLGSADANLAWARQQHSRLVNQVKAGRCNDAADTAVSLSSRAPGYYQQNVESDRNVRTCLSYITSEREKAERARATARRVNSEEATVPARPTATKNRPAKVGTPARSAPAKTDANAKDAPASRK